MSRAENDPFVTCRFAHPALPLRVFSLLVLLLLAASNVSGVTIPEPTFGPEDALDLGLGSASLGSGPSVVHPTIYQSNRDSLWYAAFVFDGDIYLGVRGPRGWHAPLRVTDEPAASRAPSLGIAGEGVCVVWEDDRGGHPEIWTRSFDGVAWSPELCLSNDGVSSRAPSFDSDGYQGLVAWQDEPATQPTQVRARLWQQGQWDEVVDITTGAFDAFEPSVSCGQRISPYRTVVWTDRRHGAPEIYAREAGETGFVAEVRLTDVGGECRHPVIIDRPCCGDWINPLRLVAFENDASGVSEVFGTCFEYGVPDSPVAISQIDGVPSHSPRVGGRIYDQSDGFFGGPVSQYSVLWEDGAPDMPRALRVADKYECTWPHGEFSLAVTEPLGTAIGGASAQPDEDSQGRLLAVWLEQRLGHATLVAREGTALGCSMFEDRGPSAILLTPAGSELNRVNYVDRCSGAPGAGRSYVLSFDAPLLADLHWDPAFARPPLTRTTGAEGYADFRLHGGGCSQAGWARLRANGVTAWAWSGAKSPDVDGDCAVREDDIAYVQSMLGTNDYCADLDGTLLVDAADVAIAQATFGERCFNLTSVESDGPATTPHLRVFPNPMQTQAVLRYDLPAAERVQVSILDVSGRVVRMWPNVESTAGGNLLVFDGRSGSGEPLSAGWYAARVSSSRGILTQPFVRLE